MRVLPDTIWAWLGHWSVCPSQVPTAHPSWVLLGRLLVGKWQSGVPLLSAGAAALTILVALHRPGMQLLYTFLHDDAQDQIGRSQGAGQQAHGRSLQQIHHECARECGWQEGRRLMCTC